jgi:ribosomal protein S6E (S10)
MKPMLGWSVKIPSFLRTQCKRFAAMYSLPTSFSTNSGTRKNAGLRSEIISGYHIVQLNLKSS